MRWQDTALIVVCVLCGLSVGGFESYTIVAEPPCALGPNSTETRPHCDINAAVWERPFSRLCLAVFSTFTALFYQYISYCER